METITNIVNFLMLTSVFFCALKAYLSINKTWRRKHVKEVAESNSLLACFLSICTSVPFLMQHTFIDFNAASAMQNAIGIGTAAFFFLVASGYWVKAYRKVGILRLALRALRMERRESTDLLRAFLQPRGAQQIGGILYEMATIDKDLDESEILLLRECAGKWNIDLPQLKAGRAEDGGDITRIRRLVTEYLELSPPREEAAHLVDVLHLFANADGKVTVEERLVLGELCAMLDGYTSEANTEDPLYEVLIVPQNQEQINAIKELLDNVEPQQRRGGQVFTVGQFHSQDFAEAVCKRYVALGLFTVAALVETPSVPSDTEGDAAKAKTGTAVSTRARLVAPLTGFLSRLRPARQSGPRC